MAGPRSESGEEGARRCGQNKCGEGGVPLNRECAAVFPFLRAKSSTVHREAVETRIAAGNASVVSQRHTRAEKETVGPLRVSAPPQWDARDAARQSAGRCAASPV